MSYTFQKVGSVSSKHTGGVWSSLKPPLQGVYTCPNCGEFHTLMGVSITKDGYTEEMLFCGCGFQRMCRFDGWQREATAPARVFASVKQVGG